MDLGQGSRLEGAACFRVCSRFSSRRSRFKWRVSSLRSVFANLTLGDSSPTSIGATASVPNAKANRVSRVADLSVFLYAYSTPRRYSTHFPLWSSNLVFNVALRVLIATYAYPLDCG